jgi:ectoine hydroxylase-related dioxygenase (phytanoyl-CoA dioxygenase family)
MQVTAWVALSDAPIESGCMEMIPGSHKLGQLHHAENDSNKILLSRGQTVSVGLDQSDTVFMPVKAGQFSLHHTHTVHRSGQNMAAWRRVGLGFSYIPTHVRCTSHTRLTAALVRGQDSFNHFDDEVRPVEDYGVSERAFHAHAVQRFKASNDEQASKY